MLCPCISIKSDTAALSENQHTVWAAIEVAGKLSKIPAKNCGQSEPVGGTFIQHDLGTFDSIFVWSIRSALIQGTSRSLLRVRMSV